MERAEKRIKLDDGKSDKPSLQQYSIISYGAPCPYYEEKLIDWLIATYKPILTVQHKSFREMKDSLNKKAPTISWKRVRSLISNKYYDLLLTIKSIFKGRKYALTSDTWTSRVKTAYTTCTVHLIETNRWKLHHFVLSLHQKEGQSTAVDVVNYTEKMMTWDFKTWLALPLIQKQPWFQRGSSSYWKHSEKVGVHSRVDALTILLSLLPKLPSRIFLSQKGLWLHASLL